MFIPGFQDIISARLRAVDCAGIPGLGGETTVGESWNSEWNSARSLGECYDYNRPRDCDICFSSLAPNKSELVKSTWEAGIVSQSHESTEHLKNSHFFPVL
mgnify:CR=1 FL=1